MIGPEQPYENKLNPDIATEDQLTRNNDELIEYLEDTGEVDASEQVDKLRQRANAAKEGVKKLSAKPTVFQKKTLEVNEEISKTLKKIREDMVDEQDTSIKTSPRQQAEMIAAASTKIKNNKLGGRGGPGDDDGFGLDDYLMARGGMSLAARAASLMKNPKFIAGAAVVASTAYIASEVTENIDTYETSNIEAEREEAAMGAAGGLAGAAIGAVAGAKAMGAVGALVGTMGFPGVGTLIGGASGVVTGAAAGAALGYYMGEGVGEYIAEMWSGPLERIPDEQRNNPFTLHSYLKSGLLPEMHKNLAQAEAMTEDERKEAGIDIQDIRNGIDEYNELADNTLKPDFIQDWMEDRLDKSGLDDADFKVQREYLDTVMQQFRDTDYYGIGASQIQFAAPVPGMMETGLSDLSDFVFGDNAEEEQRMLAEAQKIEAFNAANTLGENGEALTLSRDWDDNYDILVRNGIISDDWGRNSIKDMNKVEQLPTSIIRGLITDGYMDEESTAALQKLLIDKRAEEERAALNLVQPDALGTGSAASGTIIRGESSGAEALRQQGVDTSSLDTLPGQPSTSTNQSTIDQLGTGSAASGTINRTPSDVMTEGERRMYEKAVESLDDEGWIEETKRTNPGLIELYRQIKEEGDAVINGSTRPGPEIDADSMQRVMNFDPDNVPTPYGMTPGKVINQYSGAIRNRDLDPELNSILEKAAAETGLDVVVFSAGQVSRADGGVDDVDRVGSPRHDHGDAADVWLLDENGNKLPTDGSNPRVAQFITSAVSHGAKGIGAGPGYMNGVGVHVDLVGADRGGSLTWGRGSRSANTPEFVSDAYEAGTTQMMAMRSTGSAVNPDIAPVPEPVIEGVERDIQQDESSSWEDSKAKAKIDKLRRERDIHKNALMLSKNTKEYDTGTRSGTVSMSNLSINNSKSIQQENKNIRLLDAFS